MTSTTEGPSFPTLAERNRAWRRRALAHYTSDPGKVAEALVTATVLILGTALILATLNPDELFSDSTPTGGDMGSHVWGPRFLIDHLLPQGRLSGWTPDWYSGFPAYQFYMVVPSLFVVALHVGLPWFLAIPVLGLAGVGVAACWGRERLFRYRWAATVALATLAVLVLPLSYNRSFKIVTVIGLLGLPIACWLLAKAARLPFPIPPLAAAGGILFLFNREPLFNNTGNIIGGNFQSTMAGEFAFSVSLTLAVLYLAVAVRGLQSGKHRALAAVLFAAAGLCHLIPAFFVLGATGALFLVHPDRARFRWLATMIPVAGLLTAFWVVPFLWRRDYVNDMGWELLPLPRSEQDSVWYYLLPDGLKYLFAAAALGAVVSIVRRYSVGLVLTLAWIGVAIAFATMPQWRLWNARLLPFMYLSVGLLAAIGVGEVIRVVGAAASGSVRRPLRALTVGGSLAVIVGVLLYTLLPIQGVADGMVDRKTVTDASGEVKTESSFLVFSTRSSNPANGWAQHNYSGLEGKEAQPAGCDLPDATTPCTSGGWDEFRALIQTMAGIGEDDAYGCGRAFWEYDSARLNGYGTPMTPMMLPYFTDGCIGSQEGLYFESSTTVPYHFLMQSELSTKPSQPQRNLPYPGFDIDAGVAHLQMLGVRYYIAGTPSAVEAASRQPDLTEIAVTGPWHVYEVADSETVVALENQPVVAADVEPGQDSWLPMATAWFLSPDDHDVLIAADGPPEWDRVDAPTVEESLRLAVSWVRPQLGGSGPIDQVPELPRTPLEPVEVSDVEMGTDTISFTVSEPGVPVLVRTSYFPNWEVSGAEGPYRVTPNLMVVIPTETEVSMAFGRTPVDLIAIAMSLLGLVGVVWLARQPAIEVEPEQPPRVSRWLDRVISLPEQSDAPIWVEPPTDEP